MPTRTDYLENKCTHREYYAQFVTTKVKTLVVNVFGADKLRAAFQKDEYLNSIDLARWDNLTTRFSCDKAMRELGDYATLGGKVCVLKEAALQIIEATK